MLVKLKYDETINALIDNNIECAEIEDSNKIKIYAKYFDNVQISIFDKCKKTLIYSLYIDADFETIVEAVSEEAKMVRYYPCT